MVASVSVNLFVCYYYEKHISSSFKGYLLSLSMKWLLKVYGGRFFYDWVLRFHWGLFVVGFCSTFNSQAIKSNVKVISFCILHVMVARLGWWFRCFMARLDPCSVVKMWLLKLCQLHQTLSQVKVNTCNLWLIKKADQINTTCYILFVYTQKPKCKNGERLSKASCFLLCPVIMLS